MDQIIIIIIIIIINTKRVCSKLWKKRRNVRHREYRLGRM